MTPAEFIQLGVDEIRRIFESGRGLSDISHIVWRNRATNGTRTRKIFKRSLIVLKEYRMVTKPEENGTFDLYLTYRNHGLWLTIEYETKVRMIKKYEWENNGWEEKSGWLN